MLLLLLFLLRHIIFTLCFLELRHRIYDLRWSQAWQSTMDKNQNWWHQKLLQTHSSVASGSQPTPLWVSQAAQTKAHLLPVGLIALHMAPSQHQRRWKKLSKFTRLVPFPPLNCGRVTDILITYSAIPFSAC